MPLVTSLGSGSARGYGGLRKFEKVYAIGETGPGGGIVFYDAGSLQSWGRYLEAATSASSPAWSDSNVNWNGSSSAVSGGTGGDYGDGRLNTSRAYTQSAGGAIAAAWTYTGGGFDSTVNAATGWYMGSYAEVSEMYAQRSFFPAGFVNSNYWCSTEAGSGGVRPAIFNFGNGNVYDLHKTNPSWVRAIRAF